jgi:putative ABC transport system substrate-binding protein
MRRREFIGLAGAAAAAQPLAVFAQQAGRVRKVGWLDSFPSDDSRSQARDAAFREGLQRLGWDLRSNLEVIYRWGAFEGERAKAAAAELLSQSPDVIVCGGTPGTLALQRATRTVPIVFAIVSEPVTQGIVSSLANPGGNITGFSYMEPTIGAKWLELLKEMAPSITRVGFMFNPDSGPYGRLYYESIEAASQQFGVRLTAIEVRRPNEIEPAIKALADQQSGGLVVSADSFIYTNRKPIVDITARHRVPAIFGIPSTAADGGLIYYCVDIVESYRQAAIYVDRILRGEQPNALPVQQPNKFSLTINAATARALGITVPPALLARADEVIE